MKLLKVAAGVLNQTPLDWAGNRDRILQAIEAAREQNISVLCLPELCIPGYGCEDAFHAPGIQQTAWQMLEQIAEQTAGIVVSVGLPIMYSGGLFNTAALIANGKIIGFVAKQHLAGDGIHYEPRWFKPWSTGVHGEIEIDGVKYPIGDLIFDVGGVRIGFEICEDAWVESRPGGTLAARGADLILNPSASHFAFDKHAVRQRFVLEGSRAFHVTYVYSNLLGNEAGRAIYDGDAMIATGGQMMAVGKRFSYSNHELTAAVVNIESTRMSRARMGSFEPELDGNETDIIHADFQIPEAPLEKTELTEDAWMGSSRLKEEEFTRAVCLGLFDYVRKSRSRGFVVSLSGGCDSASVAALIWTMLVFARQELGLNQTIEKLGLSAEWESNSAQDADADAETAGLSTLAAKILTTVYQSTKNSGDVTRNAAKEVATAIHATHYELDVDAIVDNYCQIVSEAIGQELTWQQHDIALQNIQARVRAPSVWMFANLQNGLLLSTSNRSEAAVGYATMDGDTSGGLSPIAGIDKAFLRDWLRWMETDAPLGIEPIPALKSVNDQQPTAELRPATEKQTDEDDLMPYPVLDYIERLAIGDKMMPVEVFEHLRLKFDQWSVAQLGQWTIRFFQLWCRNQWKRERYAPSFHLDDKNLDPKTWCRFPILSGGFELEIKQLKKQLRSLSA